MSMSVNKGKELVRSVLPPWLVSYTKDRWTKLE